MQLKDRIWDLAEQNSDTVVRHRRHLHMYPELSFEEVLTGEYVQGVLRDLGIPFTSGWAGHGIVGVIEGNRPDSAIVALRADMDALPIQEENDVDYRSRNDGIMHACGHDVHTASLLGVAAILQDLRTSFNGTVKLIFQPGEERMPGGASIMLDEGALSNPWPQGIVGQHVYPLLPVGKVGFRSGPFMASADEIVMRIVGKGGHGAVPQFTIDPIAITAQIITALQQLISRISDPTLPSVLTFGKIESEGGTYNVIPRAVKVLGTFRTFSEEWRRDAHKKIRDIAQGIASGFGAQCELKIIVGYPSLENDVKLTGRCREAAAGLLGAENVVRLPMRLTAEDFSYYTHHMPGCFYRIGIANEKKKINSPVHTPTFDIDEGALKVGPALMAWLAINELDFLTS